MRFTRRQFVRGGVSAFTIGFAAPQFLSELALRTGRRRTQSRRRLSRRRQRRAEHADPVPRRRLLRRRPTLAVPAGDVLQIGTDSRGIALGLHPRLTGLKSIFDGGRLAIIQRTGYQNSSRSHFQGFDIWGTANPDATAGHRLAGPLSRHAAVADRSAGGLEHHARDAAAAGGAHGRRAGDHQSRHLQLRQSEQRRRGRLRAHRGHRISSHLPVDRPHLAFVNSTAQAALARSIASRRWPATPDASRMPTTASRRRCVRWPGR